jgi:hypothetical protein
VTAASYAARRYGIRSALPISRAWRLAEAARRRGEPETIFVRDDHALYRDVSARIMTILAAGGDAFQKTSVDEAYLELSSLGSFDAAVERARRLKAEFFGQEGLTASVGIGPNKLVAKIASDFQKPDGLTVVRPEDVQAFLDPSRIRVIPGIGPRTERFLHARHIKTVANLRALERAQLAEWFGRPGEGLFAKARGVSESAVSNDRERKSVGEQGDVRGRHAGRGVPVGTANAKSLCRGSPADSCAGTAAACLDVYPGLGTTQTTSGRETPAREHAVDGSLDALGGLRRGHVPRRGSTRPGTRRGTRGTSSCSVSYTLRTSSTSWSSSVALFTPSAPAIPEAGAKMRTVLEPNDSAW